MSQSLLYGTVLIFAVVLLRALFGKWLGQRLRYALWLLVAIRLLLPFQIGHSALSMENLFVSAPQETPEVYVYEQPRVPVEPIPVQREATLPVEPLRLVWYGGIAVTALWFSAVNVRFYVRARKGAKRLRLEGIPLRVYVSEGVQTPCQLGGSIFLTPQVAEDALACRHVLAHEMTHFYHGDTLWNLLRAVLLCVYWFFPPVWLAAVLSKKDCELACDEGALRRLGEDERFSYGKTLLSVAAQKVNGRRLFSAETTMAQSRKELSLRIRAIAEKKKCPLVVLLLLAMLVSLTAVCTFTGSALASPAEAPAPTVISVPETAEPSTTQPQVTKPALQTAPTETQTAPTETETTPAEAETEEMQTAENLPQNTEEESQNYQEPTEAYSDASFYGTYTLNLGEKFSTEVCLSQATWVTVKNPLVADAYLETPFGAIFQPQNCRFTVTPKWLGTTEIYFSNANGQYLAFIIHVVGNDEGETSEPTEETNGAPSFANPDFFIP